MAKSPLASPVVDLVGAVAGHLGVRMDVANVRRAYQIGDTFPLATLKQACAAHGLDCKLRSLSTRQIEAVDLLLPLLALGTGGQPFLIVGTRAGGEPLAGAQILEFDGGGTLQMRDVSLAELRDRWGGKCLILRRTPRSLETLPSVRGIVKGIVSDPLLAAQIVSMALTMSALSITTPLFFQAITNKVIPYQAQATLQALTVIVIFVLLAGALISNLRAYFVSILSARLEVALETSVFAKLLQLPLSYFEGTTTGLAARRVQQVQTIKQFVMLSLIPSLLDMLVLFVVLPVIFIISPQLSLVIIAFAVVVVGLVAIFSALYRSDVEKLLSVEGRRQTRLVETIRGVHTVKALVAEPQIRSTWTDITTEAALCNRRLARKVGLAGSTIAFFERLTTVAILAFGVELILEQRLTLGGLVAMQMLASNVTSPLTKLVTLLSDYQKVKKSAALVDEILASPTERRDDAKKLFPQSHGELEFRGVSFRYTPDRPALDDVSFKIASGSVVAVVGRSGSGKTTVGRLIQGLSSPQRGYVRIDGVDLRDINLAHHRSQLGVVLQHNYIFRASIAENIAYGVQQARSEDIVEAARAAGVLDFVGELPDGFDTVLEEDGANLSGGQRQRIAIARALLRHPKLLLLDEATSALDAETEKQIVEELRRLAKGRTVVMITHRPATLAFADTVLVLADGKVEAFGPCADVLREGGTYSAITRDFARVQKQIPQPPEAVLETLP